MDDQHSSKSTKKLYFIKAVKAYKNTCTYQTALFVVLAMVKRSLYFRIELVLIFSLASNMEHMGHCKWFKNAKAWLKGLYVEQVSATRWSICNIVYTNKRKTASCLIKNLIEFTQIYRTALQNTEQIKLYFKLYSNTM